jgi:uncharacterized membrane protein YraQ (UPF0718 family)
MKLLKTFIAWSLLSFGLLLLVYPRLTHHPLFPVFRYGTLDLYHPVLIPVVYVGSYLSKAWGPLLFAFMLGGIIAAFVPSEKMRSLFSAKNLNSYIFAALFAPVLTVCSCAMIPIFGGILMAGAGVGPAISFLLMAPAANILAIIFTGEIISWKIAIARLLFSFLGAIFVGYVLDKTPWGKREEERYSGIVMARATHVAREDFHKKSEISLAEAWVLLRRVIPYLLLGVALVSYIEAYLPREVVGTYLTGSRGIVLGAAIGVPMYTPTLVEVFFVNALVKLGMSPGAALAFLIGAPMASIPSMLGVSRIINWRCVLTYAALAVFAGMIAGFVYMGTFKTF